MSSQQNCDSAKKIGAMTEGDAIRAVYPRHTMKRLALATGAPIDTARHWLYRRLSSDRRRELARELLAELDEQDVQRSALRRQLVRWASEL
jgi:hypothetical protein